MLRSNIEKLIRDASSPFDAAKLITVFLDDQIGLYGNGWFDNDEVMTEVFEDSYDEISERVTQILSQK